MKITSMKLFVLICTIILILGLLLYAVIHLNTVFIELAEVKVKDIVSGAITTVINEESKKINSNDLLIKKGRKYIQINSVEITQIGTTISEKLQEELERTMEQSVRIPVLSALGLDILAGFGPDFAVKIVPIGYSTVPYYEDLIEDAGINNIRYKIYAIVKINCTITKEKFNYQI